MEKEEIILLCENLMLLLFLIIYILDDFFTYLAVVKLNIAFETNKFVLALWSIYGYGLGEIVHFSIFASILLFLFYTLNFLKSKSLNCFSLIILIFLIITWFFTIIENWVILFNYGRG